MKGHVAFLKLHPFLVFFYFIALPPIEAEDGDNIADKLLVIDTDAGKGSGFILDEGDQAFLYTNQHVVMDASRIDVKTTSGKKITLTQNVYFPDDERDLVKIGVLMDTGLRAADEIEFQEEVLSYGNSEGFGITRLKRGKVVGLSPTEVEYTNATVGGDSGSPVLNSEGKVVAVHTRATINRDRFIADRPDMAIRRFGTRIDNVKWIKSSLRQLFRINLIHKKATGLDRIWIAQYKQTFGKEGSYKDDFFHGRITNAEEFHKVTRGDVVTGAKRSVTFNTWFSEHQRLSYSWNYQTQQGKYFSTGHEYLPWNRFQLLADNTVQFRGRIPLSKADPTRYSSYTSSGELFPRLLSPIRNWRSDYDKFISIGFPYRDSSGNLIAIKLIRKIFYLNLLQNLDEEKKLVKAFPKSHFRKSMTEDLGFFANESDQVFKEDHVEYPLVFEFLGNRELMFYRGSYEQFFLTKMSRDDFFWNYCFTELDMLKKKNPVTLASNPKANLSLLYKNESRPLSISFVHSVRLSRENNEIYAKYSKANFRTFNCKSHTYSKHWKPTYTEKLRSMIKDPQNDFQSYTKFLNSRPAAARIYMGFVGFKLCREIKLQLLEELSRSIYDEKKSSTIIKSILRISSFYESKEENDFYRQLLEV